MQVVVLGGTRFIGRAVVTALLGAGHELLVCHRGETEPHGLPDTEHLHVARAELGDHRSRLEAFDPDAVIDCVAMTAADARLLLEALPDPDLHRVVLSSQDVYRAFASLQLGPPALPSDALPILESSALRASLVDPDRPDYSKIAVERLVLDAGAIVLRLPMTYGPYDYQRREEWILRRVRAGRRRIPVGPANGLLPLGFVHDIAQGARSALEHRELTGVVYNLVSEITDPVAVWARRILSAAESDAELVPIDKTTTLPADLWVTDSFAQPMVVSSQRARDDLGYRDTDPDEAVKRSVHWHLDHPPTDADSDFSDDDTALAGVG